jgi:hypothetical protein
MLSVCVGFFGNRPLNMVIWAQEVGTAAFSFSKMTTAKFCAQDPPARTQAMPPAENLTNTVGSQRQTNEDE